MVHVHICSCLFLLNHRAGGQSLGGLATEKEMDDFADDCSLDE